MKIIVLTVVAFAATTAVATAQISGISINFSGVMEIGMLAPNPSICGVIGGFALVGIISARRMNARN